MSRPVLIITCGLVLASAAAPTAMAEGTVNMQIHSSLPISCHADILSSEVVTVTPLAINATVQQSCNSTHDLTVIFSAASVTSPSKLLIALDGLAPSVKLSTSQVFSALAPTESVKPLTIRYNAGTLAQRQELARTWGITVAAR